MEIAERQYQNGQKIEEREKDAETPKFEFKLNAYSGYYSNMQFLLRNVGMRIISGLKMLMDENSPEYD